MIPAEKIWATRRKLKRGYPQGDLVQELLDEGYPGEEVDAIFNEMVPDNKLSQKDYSFAEVLGWGLVITGVSVLAVFSGAAIGYFFLLGGGITLLIGFFFEQEKKKFKS